MKKLLLIVLLFTSTNAFALGSGPVWGLGFYSQYLNELSSDSTAKKSTLGKTMLPVVYKSNTNLFGQSLMWHASLAGLLPAIKTNDDAANYYLIQFGLAKSFWETGDSGWFYGGGLNYAILKGNGGTTVLNNGAGTQTFYLPDGSSSSKIFYVELGYILNFSSFRLDTSIQVDNILGDSRSYSLLANFLFPAGF